MSYRRTAEGKFAIVRDRYDAHLGGYVSAGSLAKVGNRLYYASESDWWRRYNLVTEKEELLPSAGLPGDESGYALRLAYSSHYGLVAFRNGTLYRVRVDGNYIR